MRMRLTPDFRQRLAVWRATRKAARKTGAWHPALAVTRRALLAGMLATGGASSARASAWLRFAAAAAMDAVPVAVTGAQWKGYQSSSSLGDDTSGTDPANDASLQDPAGSYYAAGLLQTNPNGSATALIPSHVVQWTGKPIIGLDRCQLYPLQAGATELVVTCIHGDPTFGGMKSVQVRVAGGAWVDIVGNGQQIGALYGTPGYRFKVASQPGQRGGLVRIDVMAVPMNGKKTIYSRVMLLDDQGTLAAAYAGQVYFVDAAAGSNATGDGKSWATAWQTLDFAQGAVPLTGLVTINARGTFAEDTFTVSSASASSGWAMNDLPMIVQGPSISDLSQFVMGRSSTKGANKALAFFPRANKIIYRNVTYDGEFCYAISHNSKTGVVIFQNWIGKDASGPNGYIVDPLNNASDPSGLDATGRQTGGFGYQATGGGQESGAQGGIFTGAAYAASLDCRSLTTFSNKGWLFQHNVQATTAFDAFSEVTNVTKNNATDPVTGRFLYADYDHCFICNVALHMASKTPGKGRYHNHLTLRVKSTQLLISSGSYTYNGAAASTTVPLYLVTFDTAKDGTTPNIQSVAPGQDLWVRFMQNNDPGFQGNKMLGGAQDTGTGWGIPFLTTRPGDVFKDTSGNILATLTGTQPYQVVVQGDLSAVIPEDVLILYNALHSDPLQTQYSGFYGALYPFPRNMTFLNYGAYGPGMGNMFLLQNGQAQLSTPVFLVIRDQNSGKYYLNLQFNPGLQVGDVVTTTGHYTGLPYSSASQFSTSSAGKSYTITGFNDYSAPFQRWAWISETPAASDVYPSFTSYRKGMFTRGSASAVSMDVGISIDVNGNWSTARIADAVPVDALFKLNDCVRLALESPYANQYVFIDSVNAGGASGTCSRPIYDPNSGQFDATTGIASGPSTPIAVTAQPFYKSTTGADIALCNLAFYGVSSPTAPIKGQFADDGHRNVVIAHSTFNQPGYWQPYQNRSSAEGREDVAIIECCFNNFRAYSGNATTSMEPGYFPQRSHIVNVAQVQTEGYAGKSGNDAIGPHAMDKYVRDAALVGSATAQSMTMAPVTAMSFDLLSGQVKGLTRKSIGSVIPFDRNNNARMPGVAVIGADIASL